MAKVVKGSAVYGDDGTYLFTPYEGGKPENCQWLPLKTVDNGKLECSKKKVRMVLTINRQAPDAVVSAYTKAFGRLVSAFLSDKRIQKSYKMAENLKPCEVEDAPDEEEKQEEEKTEDEKHMEFRGNDIITFG